MSTIPIRTRLVRNCVNLNTDRLLRLPSRVLYHFPFGLAAEELQHALCTVEGGELLVAKVLHERIADEDHHLSECWIPADGDLRQQHRSDREQRAIADRQE